MEAALTLEKLHRPVESFRGHLEGLVSDAVLFERVAMKGMRSLKENHIGPAAFQTLEPSSGFTDPGLYLHP
jgi:hypothetical protein